MKELPLSDHRQLILRFLIEHGTVNKSELGAVVTSPPILNRELTGMENDGLLTITESRIGRRTYRVELTPKGFSVAEQLKKAEDAASGKDVYVIPSDFGKEFEGLSAMTHLNVLEDHIAITEHNYDGTGKDRVIMVYVKLNGRGIMRLYCDVDDSYECRHTRYAWTLPSVQEMVQIQRDKGNMKE